MNEDPRRNRRRRVRVAGQPSRPARPGGDLPGEPDAPRAAEREPGSAVLVAQPAGRLPGQAPAASTVLVGEQELAAPADERGPLGAEPAGREPAGAGSAGEAGGQIGEDAEQIGEDGGPGQAGAGALPGELAEVPDEAPSAKRARRAGRAGSRRLALPVGLGAVVVALAVVVGLLFATVQSAQSAQDARLPALSAAESAVGALLSVDYRHLSADVTRANSYLTPSFRKSYDKFRKSFAPTYLKYHTVIVASVTAGGLRDVTANSAVALLFVDQLTTGTNRSSPRVDQNRVRVTLVRQHGHWLVSTLAAL